METAEKQKMFSRRSHSAWENSPGMDEFSTVTTAPTTGTKREQKQVPRKTVYTKDLTPPKFDFLGYTFRPRRSKNRHGKYFINFSPAVSDKAGKAIRAEIRRWKLHLRSDKAIGDLSRMFNPIIRGWIQY